MKKTLCICLLNVGLVACTGSDYHRDIASINAERNSAQALVTQASLDQARMQRQNQLEETILSRQRDAMVNQTQMEKTNIFKNAVGWLFK